jgi:uncharacterized membrane protein
MVPCWREAEEKTLRNYFITGLIILLPLAVTIIIITFIFNLLTEPFSGVISTLFDRSNILADGFLFLSGKQLKEFLSQLLVLGFLFSLTVALGAIARYFFFNTLIDIWNYVIHKIPFVSSIYKSSQDIINTFFSTDTNSFKQVVLVPFPSQASYSIGLVTRSDVKGLHEAESVAVFVPTTPNPTSGFLILYPPKDLVFIDMKVEEAFKYVISCGMIMSRFSVLTKEQADALAESRKK